MENSEPTYKQLEAYFKQYFGTGNLAADINMKFALISLIGYIVYNMKKKKPDVSYYEVCYKLMEGLGFEDINVKGLAIMVEDFSYGCTNFPTFGLKPKEMPEKIREILKKYMPF
jgi:hypothetical protein